MAQTKPKYEELSEFNLIGEKLLDMYPELNENGHIDLSELVAYVCTNKTRPEGKGKLYELTAEKEPISFTNTKSYFVTLYQDDWLARSEAGRARIVLSCLLRIDPENPGKIRPLDYKDQHAMVKAFGVDWSEQETGPNPLVDRVQIEIPVSKEKSEE